eukprot:4500545-Pleurochrysis_carterae.AAC.2
MSGCRRVALSPDLPRELVRRAPSGRRRAEPRFSRGDGTRVGASQPGTRVIGIGGHAVRWRPTARAASLRTRGPGVCRGVGLRISRRGHWLQENA